MGEVLDHPDFAVATRLHSDATGGGLIASPLPSLSNAPHVSRPEAGGPFGGWMAAVALTSARTLLEIEAPLRTLSLQFMSRARFDGIGFTAERLRGARSTVFAQVRAEQEGKPVAAALLTFGASGPGPDHRPGLPEFPALDLRAPELPDSRLRPWFTDSVQYRFIDPPGLTGGKEEALERVWMRVRSPGPLDDQRLCFLLDAVFPTFFGVTGPVMATSVDLRCDLFQAIGPEVSPDGWAYFEFRTRDTSDGWAVEDGIAFAPDGSPLAVARQLRKVLKAG